MTLTAEQLSDRLDRLPASRFHVKVLVIAASSLLFDTMDTVIAGFVLAHLRTIWKFDTVAIGVVSAIGLSGYLVGSLCCGFLADRVGRKRTILLTLICYSIFSAARGLSGNLYTFAALNFCTFIFIGGESSTVPPYLAELWPSRIRGKLNGYMMAFFGMGIAVTPAWALLIIPNLGWRWALFLTAPFALVGGLMRSGLPESPRWLHKKGRVDEAESVLAWIEAKVERSTEAALPHVGAERTRVVASAQTPPRALL